MTTATISHCFPDLPSEDSIAFSLSPLPDEAMSSWLRRVARQHTRSYRQLLTALHISTEDVDFAWPWSAASTAKFLAISESQASRLIQWRLSQAAAVGRRSIIASASPGAIRVCRACVLAAEVIFFATDTRLTFVSRCQRHGDMLEDVSDELVGCPPDYVEFQASKHVTGVCWSRKFEKRMRDLASSTPRWRTFTSPSMSEADTDWPNTLS